MNQYGGFGVLFNDNVVLFESGDFGFSRESNLFGGGCPSMTPSISAAPSLTASSLAPSISAAPSSILEKGLINTVLEREWLLNLVKICYVVDALREEKDWLQLFLDEQ